MFISDCLLTPLPPLVPLLVSFSLHSLCFLPLVPLFVSFLSSLFLFPSSHPSPCFLLSSSCVLTAGSPVTGWPTVRRPTETRRWAEASVTAAAPPNMKSRNVELKWTPLWVRTTWRLSALHLCSFIFNAALIMFQSSVSGDYPYAKCFICGQNGHLSRACPDNPKGLYAQGTDTDIHHSVQ